MTSVAFWKRHYDSAWAVVNWALAPMDLMTGLLLLEHPLLLLLRLLLLRLLECLSLALLAVGVTHHSFPMELGSR